MRACLEKQLERSFFTLAGNDREKLALCKGRTVPDSGRVSGDDAITKYKKENRDDTLLVLSNYKTKKVHDGK